MNDAESTPSPEEVLEEVRDAQGRLEHVGRPRRRRGRRRWRPRGRGRRSATAGCRRRRGRSPAATRCPRRELDVVERHLRPEGRSVTRAPRPPCRRPSPRWPVAGPPSRRPSGRRRRRARRARSTSLACTESSMVRAAASSSRALSSRRRLSASPITRSSRSTVASCACSDSRVRCVGASRWPTAGRRWPRWRRCSRRIASGSTRRRASTRSCPRRAMRHTSSDPGVDAILDLAQPVPHRAGAGAGRRPRGSGSGPGGRR